MHKKIRIIRRDLMALQDYPKIKKKSMFSAGKVSHTICMKHAQQSLAARILICCKRYKDTSAKYGAYTHTYIRICIYV